MIEGNENEYMISYPLSGNIQNIYRIDAYYLCFECAKKKLVIE